jgi:phosphatidylglycerol---prolipoprotein diacylglyceryl transferase
MLQTLFYIPERLWGWPVQWIALGVWGIVAVVLLLRAVRSREQWQEFLGAVPMLAIFGAAIYFALPNLMEPGLGIPIRGFGVMLLLAVVTGVGMSVRRARQMGVDPEIIYALAFWMFVGAIVCARLFYVIEYRHEFARPTWRESLLAMLNVPSGGIVLYGALFGGLAAALAYFRTHRLPALALGDLIAPGMAMGGALGRVGCFLNGCCFGGLCEPPFPAVTFPANSAPYVRQIELGNLLGVQLREEDQRIVVTEVFPQSFAAKAQLLAGDVIVSIEGTDVPSLGLARELIARAQQEVVLRLRDGREVTIPFSLPPRSLPVHPAQLYDAMNLALLSATLWFFYPLRRRDGEVLALLLTLYPLSRFVIEIIRIDEPSQLGTGLSISQLISVGLVLLAVPFWIYLEASRRPLALPCSGDSASSGEPT